MPFPFWFSVLYWSLQGKMPQFRMFKFICEVKTLVVQHWSSVMRTAVSLYTLYSINKKSFSEFTLPHFSSWLERSSERLERTGRTVRISSQMCHPHGMPMARWTWVRRKFFTESLCTFLKAASSSFFAYEVRPFMASQFEASAFNWLMNRVNLRRPRV